jgi:hypothetical protein
MTTKDQLLDAIRFLPDDVTIRDAIEHLEEIERTERRVSQSNSRANGTHGAPAPAPRRPPMTRDELAASIQRLPENATIDDAIERLEFIKLIEERIADADAHPEERIPQEEARRRFAQWLQ